MDVGSTERRRVVRLVERFRVRARRRLTTELGRGKFAIARTAMSESVHRLGLAGVTSREKQLRCTLPRGTNRGRPRHFTQILESSCISVSVTKGVLMVGATSNVTVTTTTILSR